MTTHSSSFSGPLRFISATLIPGEFDSHNPASTGVRTGALLLHIGPKQFEQWAERDPELRALVAQIENPASRKNPSMVITNDFPGFESLVAALIDPRGRTPISLRIGHAGADSGGYERLVVDGVGLVDSSHSE